MSQAPDKEIPGMFDGPILRVAIKIGLPVLISSLLHFTYALVDTWFISRIDPSSTALLSGTGLVFPLLFLFYAISASISVGVSTLFGRLIGERNEQTPPQLMASGLAVALCIAVPALILGFMFGERLIAILAGPRLSDEALEFAVQYFRFLLPGFSLTLLIGVYTGLLQGEGLTNVIARASVVSTVSNMLMDPLCIFGLGMGVRGAGLATSLAILLSCAVVLGSFARGKSRLPLSFGLRAARLAAVREILRIGFPNFLSMAALSIGFMFLNKLVGAVGQTAMNAWAVAGRMDQIVLIPSFAVAGATVPMIAQNYGRGNLDRVRAIYRHNILLGALMVAGAAVVYNLMAPQLFARFSNVPEVVAGAVRQVRFLSFSFMGISAAIISSSAFQATGRPLRALLLTVVRMGVIAIPLSYLLVLRYHLGMTGMFSALALTNALMLPGAFVYTRYHLNRLEPQRAFGE